MNKLTASEKRAFGLILGATQGEWFQADDLPHPAIKKPELICGVLEKKGWLESGPGPRYRIKNQEEDAQSEAKPRGSRIDATDLDVWRAGQQRAYRTDWMDKRAGVLIAVNFWCHLDGSYSIVCGNRVLYAGHDQSKAILAFETREKITDGNEKA
jgi:hypothetical protein